MRHARRHGLGEPVDTAAIAIQACIARLESAGSLDAVRGCEGAASAAYFRVFGEMIRADGFHFPGRNRRPPMDPVNALLSLGYTLLLNTVEAAIQLVGLDPQLGTLHAPETGRPSLACDLVEEYRAAVVDPLMVGAINQRQVTPDDFEEAGEGEPVVVKREALRTVVSL
jgi:CRISPR-associated protein Cas1